MVLINFIGRKVKKAEMENKKEKETEKTLIS